MVSQFALAYPHLNIEYKAQDKLKLDIKSNADAMKSASGVWGEDALRGRVKQLTSSNEVDEFLYCYGKDDYCRIEALISPPGMEKAHSKNLHFFVNDRPVKDKNIRYGIMRGYHSHLLIQHYPQVYLYVTVDPTLVDVNVHPAKTEIRLQYQKEIQSLISKLIREKITQGSWAKPENMSQPVLPEQEFKPIISNFTADAPIGNRSFELRDSAPSAKSRSMEMFTPQRFPADWKMAETQEIAPVPTVDSLLQPNRAEQSAIPFADLEYIGSFKKCFLMFEYQDQLLVLDQHAFHERITFERISKDPKLLRTSQPLMVPEILHLEVDAVLTLMNEKESLQARGFDYQSLDDQTIEVSAVPTLLSNKALGPLFMDLANQLSDETQALHHVLSTIACHSSVRAGEELTDQELKMLLKEAATVDFYLNCPHGRRVFKWINKNEVESWFDRT